MLRFGKPLHTFAEALKPAADAACGLFNCSNSSIFLAQPGGKKIARVDRHPAGRQQLSKRARMGRGIAERGSAAHLQLRPSSLEQIPNRTNTLNQRQCHWDLAMAEPRERSEQLSHRPQAQPIATMTAGVRITMNNTGRKNRIMGTVSLGGNAAAFCSAFDMRMSRFSFAITRSACPTGVP